MTIVSLSLNNKILEELDKIQKEMGFSGRSEVIRAGVRTLLADMKERTELSGKIKAVLLLIHDHKAEDAVTNIKHDFLDIVYTQLHNRFREGKCLEIFILDGEAGRVKQLVQSFQKNERIEQVKLVIA
jgi:CopG family nickel-responsive transcriptional regulator